MHTDQAGPSGETGSENVKTRAEAILNILSGSAGWRSGQDISQMLGVSRAAVAKHISALRAMGHVIDSLTHRGYRLRLRHDRLRPELVRPELRTALFGKGLWLCLEETDSTNNEAIRLAMEGMAEGAVITAEKQSAGQGRMGKRWYSPPRSLQCSFILRPRLAEEDLSRLNYLGGLAVLETIRGLSSLSPRPKDPNDILVNGRKIAGVLGVTGFRGNEPDWAVLGIGCNLNALAEEFPPDLQETATSLLIETGKPVGLNLFLARLLERIEYWYVILQREGRRPVELAWQKALGAEGNGAEDLAKP